MVRITEQNSISTTTHPVRTATHTLPSLPLDLSTGLPTGLHVAVANTMMAGDDGRWDTPTIHFETGGVLQMEPFLLRPKSVLLTHTRSLQPIVQGEHLNKYRMVIAIGLQLPASKWDMPLDTEESIASCWTSMRSRKVTHVRNGILFPSRGESKEITGSLNLVWT